MRWTPNPHGIALVDLIVDFELVGEVREDPRLPAGGVGTTPALLPSPNARDCRGGLLVEKASPMSADVRDPPRRNEDPSDEGCDAYVRVYEVRHGVRESPFAPYRRPTSQLDRRRQAGRMLGDRAAADLRPSGYS